MTRAKGLEEVRPVKRSPYSLGLGPIQFIGIHAVGLSYQEIGNFHSCVTPVKRNAYEETQIGTVQVEGKAP